MNIQVLKGLVVGMAVLIVAGVAVIVVTIANRMAARAERTGAIAVEVPAGSTVAETIADGDRLVLRLETPEGPRVVVVDLGEGAVEATISLVPAP